MDVALLSAQLQSPHLASLLLSSLLVHITHHQHLLECVHTSSLDPLITSTHPLTAAAFVMHTFTGGLAVNPAERQNPFMLL